MFLKLRANGYNNSQQHVQQGVQTDIQQCCVPLHGAFIPANSHALGVSLMPAG